jgi:hypothetical protein
VDLFLARKPNVRIIVAGDGKEGLEDISVKITLNVFLRVLWK